jgi:hypothetical protein
MNKARRQAISDGFWHQPTTIFLFAMWITFCVRVGSWLGFTLELWFHRMF